MPAVIKADAVRRGEARGLAPFALTDLLEEARQTLAAARASAEKLIADARSEAIAVREKAYREGLEEGRARGLAEGREAGHSEAFEAARVEFAGQHSRLVSAFTQAVEEIDRCRAGWESAARQDLIELSVAIARRVVGPIGERERGVILKNLEEAVRLTGVRSEVSLLVHPLDAEAARQLAGRFVALLRRGGAPQLLQELQLARFMPQLRQEGGDPLQVGVDPVRLHSVVERPQALRAAALGCVAHDLRELQVGQHGGLLGARQPDLVPGLRQQALQRIVRS